MTVVLTHSLRSNLGLESMEMGQAVVASRVSEWLLSDFPGMTSLSGGVHAYTGEQYSAQVLAAGQASAVRHTASSLCSP